MSSLGIRATTNAVFIAVYCNKSLTILNVEQIKIPKALSTPLALKFIRSSILDIMREYQIKSACIRVTEAIGTLYISRIQIEGVIQEAFASSDLEKYCVGNIASISKLNDFKRDRFKPMVQDGANDLNIENWESHKKEEREAILAAIGANNA